MYLSMDKLVSLRFAKIPTFAKVNLVFSHVFPNVPLVDLGVTPIVRYHQFHPPLAIRAMLHPGDQTEAYETSRAPPAS